MDSRSRDFSEENLDFWVDNMTCRGLRRRTSLLLCVRTVDACRDTPSRSMFVSVRLDGVESLSDEVSEVSALASIEGCV